MRRGRDGRVDCDDRAEVGVEDSAAAYATDRTPPLSQRKNRPPIRRKLAPSPLALRGARHAIMLHLISSSASSASVMEVTAMTARSLSLSQALSISGGSQMMETVDSIYNRSAVGYFNNLRVPAAVLMSIISKEMFALQSTPPAAMRSWDSANGVDNQR